MELDYLLGIKNDLEADIPFTERHINGKLRKISALHKLDSTYIPDRSITLHELPDISLDSINIDFMFDLGPANRLTLGSYTALTSNASVGLIKNKGLLQLIQLLYGIRVPGTLSIHQDLKRREEYLGWKYAHELKNLDLQASFIENPNNDEVLADFAFYYRQQASMCRNLMRNRGIMDEIIKAIEVESE